MPKRILQGIVVSDAQNKTIVVRVERRVMHPVYKKFVTRSKKYAAHDEANLCKTGDMVRIEECRPISKRKTWMVIERNGAPLGSEMGSPLGSSAGAGAGAHTHAGAPAEGAVA